MYEEKPNDIIMCDFSEGSHDHPLIQLNLNFVFKALIPT